MLIPMVVLLEMTIQCGKGITLRGLLNLVGRRIRLRVVRSDLIHLCIKIWKRVIGKYKKLEEDCGNILMSFQRTGSVL